MHVMNRRGSQMLVARGRGRSSGSRTSQRQEVACGERVGPEAKEAEPVHECNRVRNSNFALLLSLRPVLSGADQRYLRALGTPLGVVPVAAAVAATSGVGSGEPSSAIKPVRRAKSRIRLQAADSAPLLCAEELEAAAATAAELAVAAARDFIGVGLSLF